MGRRVPGSPRRGRVENPNRGDGHACPSPGDPSAPLGLRPAPPAGQVPGRRPPSRPGRAWGPPGEPRAHGTGLPDPESRVQGPGVQAAGRVRRGPPRGLERPRKCRGRGRSLGLASAAAAERGHWRGAGGAEVRPRPARESGPAPARESGHLSLWGHRCGRPPALGAGAGPRPLSSLQPGGRAPGAGPVPRPWELRRKE